MDLVAVAERLLEVFCVNRFERNFAGIVRLVPEVVSASVGTLWRLEAPPFMELVVEVIGRSDGRVLVSLAHHYVQNGDLMLDPGMEVELFLESRMADARVFEQGSTGYRCLSYPRPGFVDPRAKADNNRFLATWLRNIQQQGHRIAEVSVE